MNVKYGDRKFPPKWRSSISIFYHEPTDIPDSYCDRKITYLKIVCSITGYQVGAEMGTTDPLTNDAWHYESKNLGDVYYPCYGALLQIAVFPHADNPDQVPLSDYPYIMDFEPKRRELYEAVSKSGEILGRSTSTLGLKKSGTTGETTEYASKIGAEVKGSSDSGTSSHYENSWGGGTHVQEENLNSTDASREKRETYSSTTSLTQMYELFTGYHIGSNRALFHMLSRPHTIEEKDQYTFVNGPRRLEGIQDVFLIVNRPKNQPGLCIEAFLETAHLFAEIAEKQQQTDANVSQIPLTEYHTVSGGNMGYVWDWERNTGGHVAVKNVVFILPSGCEIDTTSHAQQSFDVGEAGKTDYPPLTINVPAGIFLAFEDNLTFWRSLFNVSMTVIDGQVTVTVSLRDGGGNWPPRFQCAVTVYYKCTKMVDPPKEPTAPQSPLFLTSRGLSTCIGLEMKETSQPGNISRTVDFNKIFDPDYTNKLVEWLDKYQILDLGTTPDDYRQTLDDLVKNNRDQFEEKVRDAFNKGNSDPVPDNWLLPDEWVSYETNLSIDPLMRDPQTPALQRIRAANDLTNHLGQKMVESLRSSERYADRTVDFWHTNMVLKRLSDGVLTMPNNPTGNAKIADLDVPHKEKILATFGNAVQIKEILGYDVKTLQRGLGISETHARQLKLALVKLNTNVNPLGKNTEKQKYRQSN